MKALLVIDVQPGYVERYDEGLISRINQRIQDAAAHKELIIYVKNTKKLKSGMQTNGLAEDLDVRSPHILCKEAAIAFSNRELIGLLSQNQVREVALVGIDGNSCIFHSAMDAKNHGYGVTLPLACIGVQNTQRFEKSKEALIQKGIVIVEPDRPLL